MKKGLDKKEFLFVFVTILIIIFLALLSFALDSSDSLSTSEWRMFGRTLNGTRYNPDSINLTNFVQKWNYTATGDFFCSPVIAEDIAYITNLYDNKIFAFNATYGTLLWDYTVVDALVPPAVANNIVYVGAGTDGNFYALNATNGSLIWNYRDISGTWRFEAAPVVVYDTVYFAGFDDESPIGRVYALNATTGIHIWNYTGGVNIFSSPAVVNDFVYIGLENLTYALNATNGSQMWNYTTGDQIYSSPAVSNGIVYIGSTDDKIYALNATTGEKIWDYTTSADIPTSSPAVARDIVYIGNSFNNISAFNATTGVIIWSNKEDLAGPIESSPTIVNDILFVPCTDDLLYAFNATNGSQISTWAIGEGFHMSSPTVANDIFYIGADDNRFYAFYNDDDIPIVSFSGIINTINNGNYSGTIILNVSASDEGVLNFVFFNITNSSGVQVGFNKSSNVTGNYHNFTLNTASFNDGKYNITVYANDSVNNLNNSEYIQIVIDNTAPSATFVCSPGTIPLGQTTECTCSPTDSTSGVDSSLTEYTTNPDTTSSGTFSESCTYADYSGNTGIISVSYIVESSGSSPSPSSSSAPSVTVIAQVPQTITPETPAEITINNPSIDVTTITIETTGTAEDVSLTVSTAKSPSTAEVGVTGEAYQAFEIFSSASNKSIKNAKIEFKINKTWLKEKNGKIENIRLHRKQINATDWEILPTYFLMEDKHYYYFTASSPGFSTFVIFLGTYECTPGNLRCFEDNIQLCLGNSTWLVTETCPIRCEEGKCISTIPINFVIYPLIITIISITLLSIIYFTLRRIFRKKE
ncbi:PQQ-binding-like beta-propeller repeat protein [Candidatus Pacearchaeota archaeon]|nr:PQQ-binding-like beta-propeller repeat protein [Candidatus Pacearchaeota archaeon]